MHETPVYRGMHEHESSRGLTRKKASKFVVKTPIETDIQVLARKIPENPQPRKLNFKKTRKVSF